MRLSARFLLSCVLALTASGSVGAPAGDLLPSGAHWTADVPTNWNGTLLLWSRGYSPNVGKLEDAPAQIKSSLLAAGYALAGSDYGSGGWALEQAIPAQLATIDAFAKRYGKPKHVIAWGNSMGGLVTTALAEHRPAAIDGAAPFCSSMGGAVGMMNMALDGAYAFRTLIAPSSDIRLVAVDDDMINANRVSKEVAKAIDTPQGKARIALSGVLAGLPGWTIKDSPEPAPTDYDEQARQVADAFARGVFLPRVDQEKRAGGVFSWNTGVDYRAQLMKSGRRPFVQALYKKAGLDLDADLRQLNQGKRIQATPSATDYMMRNYTPNARPAVPVLAVQAIGDGATSPSLQQGYADAARGDVRALWVKLSGHCTFQPQTVLEAIAFLNSRVTQKHWPSPPSGFLSYRAPPMLRPCFRGQQCR